jgi:hypothetical protein
MKGNEQKGHSLIMQVFWVRMLISYGWTTTAHFNRIKVDKVPSRLLQSNRYKSFIA